MKLTNSLQHIKVYEGSHFVAILLFPVDSSPLAFSLPINYFRLKHSALAKQMNFWQANFMTRLTHSHTHTHTHISVAGITLAITCNQRAAATLFPFHSSLSLSHSYGNGNDFIITLKQFLGAALPTVCVLHIILIKVNSLRAKRKQKQSKQRQTQKRNSV